jgi:hypothetical protein
MDSIGDKYQQLYAFSVNSIAFMRTTYATICGVIKQVVYCEVTLRLFPLTIFDMEKQELLNILRVCLYPCVDYPA